MSNFIPQLLKKYLSKDLKEALDSLRIAVAYSNIDWSRNPKMAWIYHVIVGFKDTMLPQVARKHGWDEDTIIRLNRYRKALSI